jgi:hypothetical protein
MTSNRRRIVFACAFIVAGAAGAAAYYNSLVPATHPDHDHGILNLDGGGKLLAEARDGKSRNFVGRPEKVLAIHFTTLEAPGAAAEQRALFEYQARLAPNSGVEIVTLVKAPDWKTVDAWLAANQLESPSPVSVYLDRDGETTQKLNSKRPLETMFFNAEGKLSSQGRGPLEWGADAAEHVEKARSGATLE